MEFKELCEHLEEEIKSSYENGVSLDLAEKLAAKFLHGMLAVSKELSKTSLDMKMKKSGLKAVRAAVYLQKAKEGDKKPSDVMLSALVDTNELVEGEQKRYDESESYYYQLEMYFTTFKEAHIYYRGISKGKFD